MYDMTAYRSLYLEELDDQLRLMEEEVLFLERDGESVEGIQRLFRAAHTLKGSSAAMGYERMKRLTHEMEHVLEKVRNRELTVTRVLATLFFRCVDRMKKLKEEIAEQSEEKAAIDDLVDSLRDKDGYSATTTGTRTFPDKFPLSDEEYRLARQRLDVGDRIYMLRTSLSQQCVMKTARSAVISGLLGECGIVLWSDAEYGDADEREESPALWLVASGISPDELAAEARSWVDVDEVELLECGAERLAAKDRRAKEELSTSEEPIAITTAGAKSRGQTIRVSVDRLDHMMNLVGELVIDQTRFIQVERALGQKFGTNEAVTELEQISDHLARVVGDLQESVMKVRMLPIDQLFSRFPRLVRDLCHSLGKEVEFLIEGKETELDRTLIEEIGDPLIHLIRNAIDHGVEDPADRRAAGKSECGKLTVSAYHEDNQVVIVVADDGSGIDGGRLLRKAVDTGVISAAEAEAYSERQAVDLIFHPGLSTASSVSDISGRGVGMDIVRAGIEKMNGIIDVETERGRGTRFKIRLPLTLAIITGLLTEVGDQTFILPMSNVSEIVRIDPKAIARVNGVPVLTLRGQVIPITWLHDQFGLSRQAGSRKQIPIVVIGRADKRMALAVDRLVGNQDVVIKSLGGYIGQVEGIAGATILGSGKVALILEIGGIMKMAGRSV
ncbi:chemotaxis protein CheA [Cohnella faecalis]|uniref:Chemotaxis protein CheA n=1 Tax=Cohnella faecalis TaxID=2315694 RepID=A0A398CJJ6_9BACL|nr:chemotaxis protein CheA [Cohnella faecalis]RIE02312.1 chemotaxis protein CheA [Cohnella faecalis]